MLNNRYRIRKRWLMVAAAAALLTVVLAGGTALATTGPGQYRIMPQGPVHHYDNAGVGQDQQDAVLDRVAEIIGVELDTLVDAVRVARDERAAERFDAIIASRRTEGALTPDQECDARAWFRQRPAQSGPTAIVVAHTANTQRADYWLQDLVARERLTRAEADAISAWHTQRPASLPEGLRQTSGEEAEQATPSLEREQRRSHWHGNEGD